MAINPSSSPGGNAPPSGPPSGNGQIPPAKPRATIIKKSPSANGASAASIPAAGKSVRPPIQTPIPGASASQRLPQSRASVGAPSQSSRRPAAQIQTDREALGLSAARPSEMVAGLDEAVKRAEALASREEARRKSGGKLNLNEALHVDDTGRKWALWVQLGIALLFIGICVAGGLMMYGANHRELDPRIALAETRASLFDLEITAKNMDRFESGEAITPEAVKSHMQKTFDGQLESIKKSLQKDRDAGRTPDKSLLKKRDEIEKLKQFKDGWGTPFVFAVTGDELHISSATQAKDVPSEPVKVNLRAVAGEKSEKRDNK